MLVQVRPAPSFFAHSEEKPLQLLAVALRVRNRITGELVVLVKLLGEVEQDCRRFEDRESVMCDGRDTPIRVDLRKE